MKGIFPSLLLSCFPSLCVSATIVWDIPKKSDVAGYFLHYHTESGVAYREDIGLRDYYKLDTAPNKKYIIWVVQYDKNKREGQPSEKIEYKEIKADKEARLPKPHIRIR